jgi:large conductance mechanosensitive channel
MKGFVNFIREQGVVGLAVGFILGGAVSKVVSSLVADIISPMIGLFIGQAQSLKTATFVIGKVSISWGNFISNFLDFIIISAVVYYLFSLLHLYKLDKPKS